MTKTEEQDFLDSLPDSENDFLRTIPDDEAAKPDTLLNKATRYMGESLGLPFRGYRAMGVGAQRLISGDEPSAALDRASAATVPGYVPRDGERIGAAIGSALPTAPLGPLAGGAVMGGATGLEELAKGSSIGDAANKGATEAAINMAAGKVAEKGVPYIKSAIKGIPTKFSEMLTNVRANKFAKLVDDPSLILPNSFGGPAPMAEAKALYKTAAEGAGFIKGAAKEVDSGIGQLVGEKNPFKGANEVAANYFERVSMGEKLSPEEVFHFYQNVGEKIRPVNINTPKGAKAINIRQMLKKELSDISPDWSKAADVYDKSITGKSLGSLYPKTDTGRPAFGRMFGGTTVAGIASRNPAALIAGAAAVSPFVHSIAYASAGAGLKALEKVLQTPGANMMVLAAIQSILRGVDEEGDKK